MNIMMRLSKKTTLIFVSFFLLSLLFRAALFHFKWSNLRHGSAIFYGSTAIGLYKENSLSYNESELLFIDKVQDNHSANYLNFHEKVHREKFKEFLPGPALLLSILWNLIPIYNFSPYIYFQIFIESLLIPFLFLAMRHYNKRVALLTALITLFNLALIKRTLMMGYDFWPQFCVLVNFIFILYYLRNNNYLLLFMAGSLSATTVWFRSITTFLPFLLCIFLFFWQNRSLGTSHSIRRISVYILPVLISITLLSTYRYHVTGNYRPTRSTFWHTFFAGVSQFSNPYGLVNNDDAIWEFASGIDPNLINVGLSKSWEDPNSLYEIRLKSEGSRFIKEHPVIFVRNIIYRAIIMISPLFYTGGDFLPQNMTPYFFFFGSVCFLLWFCGLYFLYYRCNSLFWISITFYTYFFLFFSWFYIVGRVILPFLFIDVFMYLFGIELIIHTIKSRYNVFVVH
jgi:hypothetical protein